MPKFDPFAKLKAAMRNEEGKPVLALGFNREGLWNFGLGLTLTVSGAFIWHIVNPFLYPPPSHEATFAKIREKDEAAAEHIEEIAKAVKYDMPLSARLAYKDQPESRIAQASGHTPTEEEGERKQ